ncbi:hypothetical protein T12_9147 [Trichinella patagoniensis]|uniref:Uncharacterized protein n=1 Tax=Trichinella patagoniensis TaxID=990121 RepID=A0A0V0ZV75_9BILA|nr:hypothetical protein T12_9147 [Trichinella patagoniensis]
MQLSLMRKASFIDNASQKVSFTSNMTVTKFLRSMTPEDTDIVRNKSDGYCFLSFPFFNPKNYKRILFWLVFCTIDFHPSWSLNAVLCYALALRGALYALHVLINVAWLRYQ